jgi:hypothetical protein
MRAGVRIAGVLSLLVVLALQAVNQLSNADYVIGLAHDPESSPALKMIGSFIVSHATPPWLSLAIISVAASLLYISVFGIPFHKTKSQIAEETIFEKIVETHGQGGSDGIPINTFFKCGGHKLPSHSIRTVSKRLRKVGLSLFPTDQVPKRQQLKFIRRVRKIGRPLNAFQQATDAFEEWERTGTLRAAWEPQPEPTGFHNQPRTESDDRRNSRLQQAAEIAIQAEKTLKRMRNDVQMVPPPDSPLQLNKSVSLIDIIGRRLNEIESGVKGNLRIIGLTEALRIEPDVAKQIQSAPKFVEHIEPQLIEDAYAIDRDLTWPAFRQMGIAVKNLNRGIERCNETPSVVFSRDLLRKIKDVRKCIAVIEDEKENHGDSLQLKAYRVKLKVLLAERDRLDRMSDAQAHGNISEVRRQNERSISEVRAEIKRLENEQSKQPS